MDANGNCIAYINNSGTPVELYRSYEIVDNFYLQPPDSCMAAGNDETNPCDPATGNKSQTEHDYITPTDGGLSFSRYYNSEGAYKTGSNMGASWRHTYSRTLNEVPDRNPTLSFVAPADQSAVYLSASDACTTGWADIKVTVWGGDLAAAIPSFAGGNVCKIELGGSTVAYFPVRSDSGWAGFAPPISIHTISRASGSSVKFEFDGNAWVNELNPSLKLASSGGNWIFTDTSDTQELYNSSGQLMAITYRDGTAELLEYNLTVAQGGDDDPTTLDRVTGSFGHSISFAYDANGLLSAVVTPDGTIQYAYDGVHNLSAVIYPDLTDRQYHYEDASLPNHLTGITDENGDRFATWAFDDAGRAILSEHAGGIERVQLVYNPDGSTTLTTGNGAVRNYYYTTKQGHRKLTMLTGDVCGTCPNGDIADRTYDANGFLDEVVDWNENVTKTQRNARGLTETLTEALGTSAQRISTITWHPTYRLPQTINTPRLDTSITYYPNGDVQTLTISVLTNARTWSFSYNGLGQPLSIDGPRTDVSDVTLLDYHECATGSECGQLESITNALGQVTSFDEYDASGRLKRFTDPNLLQTSFQYDSRGNLETVTKTPAVGVPLVTSMTYTDAGQLWTVTAPDGLQLTYDYDAAHYLRSVTDNFGNHIDYDYDSMGNLSDTDIYDGGGVLMRAIDSVYDINNYLDTVTSGGFATDFDFDLVGNLIKSTDPDLNETQYVPDALNRMDYSIDALLGQTDFSYDTDDNIKSVIAPNGAQTSYLTNKTIIPKSEAGPDRGGIAYVHDSAGNLKTKTDARGKVTNYGYDAENRLDLVTFDGGETIDYEYDIGVNAIGRLNKVTDSSGQTTWSYDNFGRTSGKIQTIGTVNLSTVYQYDLQGRLQSMTLPSGKAVTYGYDTYLVTSVSVDGQTILAGASYDPFGPVSGWTWGKGTVHSRHYDLRGMMDSQSIVTDIRTLTYHPNGHLATLSDDRHNLVFDYDELGRVADFDSNAVAGGSEPLFAAPPAILASIQTRNNETASPPGNTPTPWITTAIDTVTVSQAKFALERSQVNTGAVNVAETIGYIAITAGQSGVFAASDGQVSYEAQLLASAMQGWGTCIASDFLNNYSTPPLLIATKNSRVASDGGWLRRCSLSTTQVGLTNDEDTYTDAERNHPVEAAGMVAFSRPFDARITDGTGSWRMESGMVSLPDTNISPVYTQITFRQSYPVPPVVVVVATNQGSTPADIRIRNVTTSGFEAVQVEPANYDGEHEAMTMHYIAVERGVHELPGGTRLDANLLSTNKQKHGSGVSGSQGWSTVTFANWPGNAVAELPVSQVFQYDSNGNRTSLVEDGVQVVYSIAPNSNRLNNFYYYDASGNVVVDKKQHSLQYDDGGRRISIDLGVVTYDHNGLGERVVKSNAGFETLFAYDESGRLIGEYYGNGSGAPIRETVYLGDVPVAVVAGNKIFYVHTDHLGTPRVITESDNIIWRWESDPFGTTLPDEDPDRDQIAFEYNQRFPGQYFDEETGHHYNYYRTYDPSTGRYLESDPIGLGGGLNTYSYVGGNPLTFVDPFGLNAEQIKAMLRLAVRSQADLNVPSKIGVGKFPGNGSAITNPITRNITLDNFYLDNDLDCYNLQELLIIIVHESIHRTRPRIDSILRPFSHDDIEDESRDRVTNNEFLQQELSDRCECTPQK